MTSTLRPCTRERGFTFLGVVILIAVISWVALLVIPYIVRGAGHRMVPTPLASPHMVPESVVFTALGGVTVALREVDVETKRFVFVVRGADVTGIPQGLHMAFEFDTPVWRITPTEVSPGILVESYGREYAATCVLYRDPFSPPEPWSYTVQIVLEDLPESGRIAVWDIETHDVRYRVAPRPVSALVTSPES